MTGLLSNAGRAALLAFGSAVIVLAPGVINAPNLGSSRLLAVAALIAGLDAAIKVLTTFVPKLKTPWPALDAFFRAGIAVFFIFLPGLYTAPDLATLKSAATALMIGVANALLRIGQGVLTSTETATGAPSPEPSTGFDVPDRVPRPETP